MVSDEGSSVAHGSLSESGKSEKKYIYFAAH